MKRKLSLLFILLLSAAQAEMSTSQTAQMRKILENFTLASHVPRSSPNDNGYYVLGKFATKENIPMAFIDKELIAVLEEQNALLRTDIPDQEQGRVITMCRCVMSIMGRSGKREFLPLIEQMALVSVVNRVRVDAVNAHIAICGFDSFQFIKKAVESFPNPKRQLSYGQQQMYKAILEYGGNLGATEKRIDEIRRFAMENIQEENSPLTLAMDGFLVKHESGYSTSKQRMGIAKRFQDYHEMSSREAFTRIAAQLEELPESQRTDLNQRFKHLKETRD